MGTVFDISVPLGAGAVGFPGDPPFRRDVVGSPAEAAYELSQLSMSAHAGTHLDFPSHVVPGGKNAGERTPPAIYRHVSSGSSFGANPLQQTIGVGKNDRIALLEITWPTSGTTQVFRDVAVNQAIEITEFAKGYRKLDWKPIVVGK